MDPSIARTMWQVLDPYHAVVYFSPAAHDIIQRGGLRGFWRGYFATRAAPLGRVPAETVTAVFYNFHPAMVARAIPHVWDLVEPEAAWPLRLAAADAALRSALGADIAAGALDAAATAAAAAARTAVAACDPAGRALFASHMHLPWPDEPHLVLWQAATMLREHRGDGHNASLLAAGIDGCEAHVLADAAGRIPRRQTQPNRGWSDDDWQHAAGRLAHRGILTPEGRLTPDGARLVAEIEDRTDRAALGPWRELGAGGCEALRTTMAEIAQRIYATAWFPRSNPIGVPAPC